MSHPSLATTLSPSSLSNRAVYEVVLFASGVGLLALSAQVGFPLPFSPVPVTMQTLVVLWLGSSFGVKRGSATIVTYLLLGTMGLPIFSGGLGGIARLLGPTGGYLAGFFLAGILVGYLAERGWDRRMLTAFGAMLPGNLVIYAVGLFWLSRFVPEGALLGAGLYPFLVGDVFKLIVATLLLPLGWRLAGRRASEK